MSDQLKYILLAEDEEDIQMVTEMALADIGGFEVKICDNGKQAVEAVGGADGYMPDLIILDVMMPEMDGQTALKIFKSNDATKDIPVIMMTARVQPEVLHEYRQEGAAEIIAKPFDPVTLAQKVEEIWLANK